MYLDQNAQQKPCVMGSYGIGLNRTMQAIIEQSHDADGIIWPDSVAPYSAIVVPVSVANEAQRALAEEIYAKLNAAGIETLIDDRDERAGVKFKDADLIGIPHRVVIGERGLKDGQFEYKGRRDAEPTMIAQTDIVSTLQEKLCAA
ncbi:Proline--tRNA ligase [bioreactor metagenome]|uniref:Proline--tRNA ligase n=1 Tax=bioreactor metagenome TaxID=1076179 RepID=A0A645HR52_9ZZZZ